MPRPKKTLDKGRDSLDAEPMEDVEATTHEPVENTERFLGFQRGTMRKKHIREEDPPALPDLDHFIDPSELWP